MFAFIKQVFRGFSLVVLCILTIPAAIFVCILGGFIFLPLPANLPTANATMPSQPSHIYDINGNEIAELRQHDVNIPVQKSDIPEIMKQATIASEDKNFYKHQGIDLPGTFRALKADITNKKAVQGGSTITQQYVKLAYTNSERTIQRKIREAVLASQLDRQVDKDEILYRYLSMVYFGDGTYGIGAAAQSYFHVPVNQLNASQAATLVGVIPSPSNWAPRDNPTTAENRRKAILGKMLEQKYITQEQHDDAIAHPLWLESQGTPPGPVTMVYDEEVTQIQYPYFVDYARRYLIQKYGEDAVYRGGLRVQTTLDPPLQAEAEKAVGGTLKGTSAPLSMSLVSVEPQTGFVKALVGGRDFYAPGGGQVNLALGSCPQKPTSKATKIEVEPSCWKTPNVTGGGSGRQPGSSFKPFVLAAAYEEGMSPSKIYADPAVYTIPGCKGTQCQIHNAEGESKGPISIKEAMAYSLNTVYSPLSRDVGFVEVGNMAKKLGLEDAFWSSTIHTDSGAYALGTISVSPLEMAASYGVFANRGERQPATPVVKVFDSKGQVLEDNSARKGIRVLSEPVADNVTDALRGVIDHGTAANTANIGRPAAGKTGTTSDYTDAWFVGYTPTLSTSVWMGNANNTATINYKGNRHVYGGTVPAATWAAYMKAVLKDVPPTEFSEPAPIVKVNSDALAQVVAPTRTDVRPKTNLTPSGTPTPTPNQVSNNPPAVAAPASITTTTVPPPVEPVEPQAVQVPNTTQPKGNGKGKGN